MNLTYRVLITQSRKDKRFTVQFYDLPEAITEGETLDEALSNAKDVLSLTLEGRLD